MHRHPVLEARRRRLRPRAAPEVGERAERRLDDPEARDDVLRHERVGEELALVVDPREPRPGEELVAEHLVPQALDRLQLREEAVAAEIEPVALELDRLRDPADDAVGLEDLGGATA